jgi:hypothetical protein
MGHERQKKHFGKIGNGYFLLKRKYNDNQKRINMSIATSFPKNYNLGNYYNTNNKSKQVYNNQKQFGNPAVIQPVQWKGNREQFIKTANEAGADAFQWSYPVGYYVPLNNGQEVLFTYQTNFVYTTRQCTYFLNIKGLGCEGYKYNHHTWSKVFNSNLVGGVYKFNNKAQYTCDNIIFSNYLNLPSQNWVSDQNQYYVYTDYSDAVSIPYAIQSGGYYENPNTHPIISIDGKLYDSNCNAYPVKTQIIDI